MIYGLLCSILPTTLDLFGVATLVFTAKGVEAIESSNSPAYLLGTVCIIGMRIISGLYGRESDLLIV